MFDLLLPAISDTTLAQVMDIINNILANNPFEVLNLRLLEAHELSDQEKMDACSSWDPWEIASLLSFCHRCCQCALLAWSFT